MAKRRFINRVALSFRNRREIKIRHVMTSNYQETLNELKSSFSGGAEGLIHIEAIRQKLKERIDWLEIGIGTGNNSLIEIRDLVGKNNISITGIDPNLGDTSFLEREFFNIKLLRNKFEDFDTTCKFDVVCATHSVYYLNNPLSQVDRMINFTKAQGSILITCWSEDDILYKINRDLFGSASQDITGESILHFMKRDSRLRNVKVKYFTGNIDLTSWTKKYTINAALNIISRSDSITEISEEVISKFQRFIESKRAVNRINAVISAEVT